MLPDHIVERRVVSVVGFVVVEDGEGPVVLCQRPGQFRHLFPVGLPLHSSLRVGRGGEERGGDEFGAYELECGFCPHGGRTLTAKPARGLKPGGGG